MRRQDKQVFLQAARHFSSWLLVRRTNRDSLPYIGLPGYTPKPIDCKAKTADKNVGSYVPAGLVADPTIHPLAFEGEKAHKAARIWTEMKAHFGSKYSVETNTKHKHYGCLKCEGKFLHGDYDLKDIVDTKAPTRNLALVDTLLDTPHRWGAKFWDIQSFINTRIGSPMVQHGAEAQYAGHAAEAIDVFGPNGEDFTLLNKISVEFFYSDTLKGRRTLS